MAHSVQTQPGRTPSKALSLAEGLAPFMAGLVLLGSGFLTVVHRLGFEGFPAGPLADASTITALLVAGAGLGIVLAAWELFFLRRQARSAVLQATRAHAERDLALLQARRMRAQAEGLALMREIHRSTAIAEPHDRLHRILTLVSDLFDAREVVLFAASSDAPPRMLPAAYLRTAPQEEIFAAFDTAALEPFMQGATTSAALHLPKARNATLACEGSRLFLDGSLVSGDAVVARVRCQRSMDGAEDPAARQDAGAMLEALVERLDYGADACRHAAQALEQRRTLRQRVPAALPRYGGADEALLICVPLIAGQRPVGVLRIRRSAEGFDGPEAETLEEMLCESAKHIALAMKKDLDDRKAITDQLTGLFIKRHFLSTLEELRAQVASEGLGDAGGNGKTFALVLLDIDHFKKVNDTHGHLSGDLVLKGVAGVLSKGLRSGDRAFRYGGEELAVLMPGGTPEAAEQAAERLRAAVQQHAFKGEKGQGIPVTVSLGLSQFRPGLSGKELISRADRALYASKNAGRNRVTAWRSDLPDPL